MNLGDFILDFRKKADITQEELAQRAGLARSYIARLERGDFEDGAISIATFIRLAKALEVPLYKFFQSINFINPDRLPSLGISLQRARKHNRN